MNPCEAQGIVASLLACASHFTTDDLEVCNSYAMPPPLLFAMIGGLLGLWVAFFAMPVSPRLGGEGQSVHMRWMSCPSAS